MKTGILSFVVVFAALAAAAPPVAYRASAELPAAPLLPDDLKWVVGLLIAIIALFAAAALIGPIYRLNLPEEFLPTHSHDEPPGASHHHGPSGTIDYSAPERHHPLS
jgi:hypothetical protein